MQPHSDGDARCFPFTVWDDDAEVWTCEDCGAWQPEDGQPLAHNRTCKFDFMVEADAYARNAAKRLPEGKTMLYTTLGDGTAIVFARGQAALDLWYEFAKPRLVNAYVEEVRRAAAE